MSGALLPTWTAPPLAPAGLGCLAGLRDGPQVPFLRDHPCQTWYPLGGGILRRRRTSAIEIYISASRWVRACGLAVPSLPRPKQMIWPGDRAASLAADHHPCAGIPLPDPGWPTMPLGSLSDGSRGDPAPGAKCGKRRTDQTHRSRRGRPTLTVAGGRGRLQPELIVTLDLHDGSGRPRHKPIRMQCRGCPRPIHCSGLVDRYKYQPGAHKSPRTPLKLFRIGG